MKISTTVNEKEVVLDVNPGERLLTVLRREGYFGVKNGCDEGSCGSCVVLIDGLPMKSCLMFIGQVQGRTITTIEGIHTHDRPHIIEDFFVEEAGVQCGFCIPGMILSAKSLLDHNQEPSEREIKEALSGNICRCTGYVKQIKAVKMAAAKMRADKR